jgi:1-deoxy-D-xylulose-5-phosphate synthase
MLHDATSLADEGPVVIRYPRGAARQVSEHEVGVGLHGRRVRVAAEPATSVCVIAIGKMLDTAEKAAEVLAEQGVDVTVWDARSCAPLDPDMIADAAQHRHVVTIEDGIRDGGIGMAIATDVCEIDGSVPVTPLGLPTKFHPHDPKPGNIHTRYGLDVDGLVTTIRST